jgi:hypothetical protein
VDASWAANGRSLPVMPYGDSTREARLTSSKTDCELIRIYFRSKSRFKLDLDIPRANPPVRDLVNSVNAMLKNAGGDMWTRVHLDCRELITDCPEVTWKQGALNYAGLRSVPTMSAGSSFSLVDASRMLTAGFNPVSVLLIHKGHFGT